MEMKILWAGAMFLVGWLWFYLFIRQFLFNFIIAFPMIKKIRSTSDELITKGAEKYTWVSVVTCSVFIAIILFVVLRFCKIHLLIGFFAGAVIGLAAYFSKLNIRNREMFDIFCASYYLHIPDDELRTSMYNKKPSQMKVRLHSMGLSTDFIPEFK